MILSIIASYPLCFRFTHDYFIDSDSMCSQLGPIYMIRVYDVNSI
jgi:hypothetical protein